MDKSILLLTFLHCFRMLNLVSFRQGYDTLTPGSIQSPMSESVNVPSVVCHGNLCQVNGSVVSKETHILDNNLGNAISYMLSDGL